MCARFADDTFWGGFGHRALNLLALVMALLVATPLALMIALPFIG